MQFIIFERCLSNFFSELINLQIIKNYIILHITRFIRSKLTAPSIIDGAFLLISVEKEILKKYQHPYQSGGEGGINFEI
jgi:hypothetical protein